MKVKHKKTGVLGSSRKFNIHGMSEIIVGFDDEDMDSDFISEYDVYLESKKEWKPMSEAFRDKDIITNNYNTEFREPQNEAERQRGWYD